MALAPNQVLLRNVRQSFFDYFEPKAFKEKSPEMFRGTFLIEPDSDNAKAIEAAIDHVGNDKFKKLWSKKKASFEGSAQQYPYHDGNKKTYAGYEDMMSLTAVRKAKDGKPVIVNRDKTPLGDDGTLYSGCYVNAKVEFWAQDGENPGIRCALLSVQFWAHGDRFGGGSKPTADDFEEAENLNDQGEELA